jgi:ABC-type antimicrobial peptide transport system permease subunit
MPISLFSIIVFGSLTLFLALLAVLIFLGKVPLRYNLRNMTVRWPITLLTGMAFILVIGLMTVMLAFVNGLYQLTQGSGQPGNVMVLADGATDELFSNLGTSDITQLGTRDDIVRDEDGHKLVSWETYVVVNQPIANAVKGGRMRRFLQVRGMQDPVLSGRVHNLPLHEGGAWFSEVQDLPDGTKAIQAVLGEGMAREMGKDQHKASLQPGDVFDLGPRKWVVTGVLKSSGSTFDSEIWAKQSRVGEMFGKPSFTTVVLRTADAGTAKTVADDLTRNYKTPAVSAETEKEYYEKLNNTNAQFLGTVIFIVIIMAVGGVFGVMNAMFAAVSQRTKDIGVLRILGYMPLQVLMSFFLESLLLAVLGGLLGCAIGSLCHGFTASSIAGSGAGGGKSVVLKLVVDQYILATGLGFALVMGALGGLVPALSAMRLKPLESLR